MGYKDFLQAIRIGKLSLWDFEILVISKVRQSLSLSQNLRQQLSRTLVRSCFR